MRYIKEGRECVLIAMDVGNRVTSRECAELAKTMSASSTSISMENESEGEPRFFGRTMKSHLH